MRVLSYMDDVGISRGGLVCGNIGLWLLVFLRDVRNLDFNLKDIDF